MNTNLIKKTLLVAVLLAFLIAPVRIFAQAPFYAGTTSSDSSSGSAPGYDAGSGGSGSAGYYAGGSAVTSDYGSYSTRYPTSYFEAPILNGVTDVYVVVNTCRDINVAGTYVLDRNLESAQGACLTIRDSANIHLNCNGFSVLGTVGLRVKNMNGFSVKNCRLNSSDLKPLIVEDSKGGDISNNTIGPAVVTLSSLESVRVADNTIGASVSGTYLQRVTFENNTLSVPAKASGVAELIPFAVHFSYGLNNKITRNAIDGRAGSIAGRNMGAQDGIKISDESGDTISSNTVRNVGNCGIHTIGYIYNSTFSANYIKNAGFCGIGADSYMSWDGNKVDSNTIDTAPQMFSFVRVYGLRPAGFDPQKKFSADPRMYFKDNTFSNNKYVNASLANQTAGGYASNIVVKSAGQIATGSVNERELTDALITIENNRFNDNNFSRIANAPLLYPYGMIVDGGANVCGYAPAGYPLSCGTGNKAVASVITAQKIAPKIVSEKDSSIKEVTKTKEIVTTKATTTASQTALALSYAKTFMKFVLYFLIFLLGLAVGILVLKVLEKEKKKEK